MAVSKQQLAWAKKYHETLDEIKIRTPKGMKAYYKELAKKDNKSLNYFVITAIEEYIEKHNLR